jgi:hypothetical protein
LRFVVGGRLAGRAYTRMGEMVNSLCAACLGVDDDGRFIDI